MAVIMHLLGITFFAALATSGYITTTQIMYWVILSIMFFVNFGNLHNTSRNIKRKHNGRSLTVEMNAVLPFIEHTDFNSRIVHLLFANIIHAVIAFQLLNAPFLAITICIMMALSILNITKFKELVKICRQ